MIHLNRRASEPLHQQLYRQIRDELGSGSFSNTTSRLPSSRSLATNLGVSRPTVNRAFAKLHAEGFLRSKAGSGTFVADRLPEAFLRAAQLKGKSKAARRPRISERAAKIPDQRKGKQFDIGFGGTPGDIFVPGHPAVDEFPIAVWERLKTDALAKKGAHLLRYASSRGDVELRKAVAAYLCDFRGARCHPDQIVIVAGTQQAILISAMALINPGEPAWIEDPGYTQARRALFSLGQR